MCEVGSVFHFCYLMMTMCLIRNKQGSYSTIGNEHHGSWGIAVRTTTYYEQLQANIWQIYFASALQRIFGAWFTCNKSIPIYNWAIINAIDLMNLWCAPLLGEQFRGIWLVSFRTKWWTISNQVIFTFIPKMKALCHLHTHVFGNVFDHELLISVTK